MTAITGKWMNGIMAVVLICGLATVAASKFIDQTVCTVPDERKAQAVKDVAEGEVTEMIPASILKKHRNCWMYLDEESAAMLQLSVDGRQSSVEKED